MRDINKRVKVPGPAFDTELMRVDRLSRFLVVATECPGSGFRHYGLTGRMTRIGRQLGWTEERAHAEIWHRYSSHLAMYRQNRDAFMATSDRLRLEYGDEVLIRWGVLSPSEARI